MTPVILLSSNTPALGVMRALGEHGIPIINYYHDVKNDFAYQSKFVQEHRVLPHPELNEQQCVDAIISEGRKHHGSLLIPLDDASLVTTSKNKSKLEEYFRVVCCNWSVIKLIIEKKYTYDIAEKLGIPSPKSRTVNTISEAEIAGKEMQYPCLIKPSVGHRFFELFHTKMIRVDSYDELCENIELPLSHKLELIVQEMIPGNDTSGINYNSYYANNRVCLDFTAEKVRLAPPNFGFPRVVISKHISAVTEYSSMFLNKLGYTGYSCIEYKRDERDGVYKLMELNGRFNLSILHALKCGINFPYLAYNHEVNGVVPEKSDFQDDIYWIDSLKDITHSVRYCAVEKYTPASLLKPYLKPHICAIFNAGDIKPFFKKLSILFWKVFSKLTGEK